MVSDGSPLLKCATSSIHIVTNRHIASKPVADGESQPCALVYAYNDMDEADEVMHRYRMRRSLISLGVALALCTACTGKLDGGTASTPSNPNNPNNPNNPGTPIPSAVPGDRLMRRVTATEYAQSVQDVLEIAPSGTLPVDVKVAGLSRVGAGSATINALAVEQYEAVAHDLGPRAFSDSARARRLSGCTPTGVSDSACARTAVTRIGSMLFRGPLSEADITRYTNLALAAAAQVGSFDGGLGLAVSGMLQSPRFLNHIEIGEAIEGSATRRRYTGYEMAARLASFLWDSVPDQALTDAAASGALLTDDGLRTEATRMLADSRARTAVVRILMEHLDMDGLESSVGDEGATAGVAAAMREEVRRVLEANTFDEDGSLYRDLFTRDTSYVNGPLAAHYGLSSPTGASFELVTLPANRRGLLSLGAVVASHGHGGRTSPTLRGLFVRQRILCTDIPLPPPGVPNDLSLAAGPTARDRLMQHATEPSCAGCHLAMDPIGLGFEQFDVTAAFRTQENGADIDPSGTLDGTAFTDAASLGAVVHDHPALDACLAKQLFRAAAGRRESTSEQTTFRSPQVPTTGLSIRDILFYVILSEPFRTFEPQT